MTHGRKLGPERASVLDLLRPSRLFRGIDSHPNFVFPCLVFISCVVCYTQLAIGAAMPQVMPRLLEHSLTTESELARSFRYAVLVLSVLSPVLFVVVTAGGCWMITLISGSRTCFANALSLVSYASLWIALGFLAKTGLVALTGIAEPATNLSFFVRTQNPSLRTILALTNPFVILALVWTVMGLRFWGLGPARASAAGGIPWILWVIVLAHVSAGAPGRFAPSTPVHYEDWKSLQGSTATLRHPADLETQAQALLAQIDSLTVSLSARLDFEPRRIQIYAFPDHSVLERACGEFLHVQVPGSVRGQDLLYVEMPGRSAALTEEAGRRQIFRYVAIMQLAPVFSNAPRWFTEGIAHALTNPFSRQIELEYRRVLKRRGVPTFQDLLVHELYQTPEGPILARGLVDYLGFHYGRETLLAMQKDLVAGGDFRDVLFARTRLTARALELGWQERVRALIETPGSDLAESPAGAESDTLGASSPSVEADSLTPPEERVSIFPPRH